MGIKERLSSEELKSEWQVEDHLIQRAESNECHVPPEEEERIQSMLTA